MPAAPTLNFREIRPHHDDRRLALEELTRQILIASPPPGMSRFEHKGAGADGGVEVLVHFPDGTCWGYQTKYFLDDFGASELTQVKKSYASALAAYPTMTRYVVGIPHNLASAADGTLTQRVRWDRWVTIAEAAAAATGRAMEIELWDESRYVSELTPDTARHAGIRLYWFNDRVLTPTWFASKFSLVKADLAARYSLDEHQDVAVQGVLDAVSRSSAYRRIVDSVWSELTGAKIVWNTDRAVFESGSAPTVLDRLDQALEQALGVYRDTPFARPGPLDVSPLKSAAADIQAVLHTPEFEAVMGDHRNLGGATAAERQAATDRKAARSRLLFGLDRIRDQIDALQPEVVARNRVLVVGEAGAGKSHALAHMVEGHLAAGGPAVMALGQNFLSGNPRADLLEGLEFEGTFDVFLAALQAAALAAGKPAVIAIDAINESHDPTSWARSLSGIVKQVAQFDHLALVVSCRETYEVMCVPPGIDLYRVVHRGFEGDGGRAARRYVQAHGVEWPSGRFLDVAFTNPLFLSTAVRHLRAQGLTRFPDDLEGHSDLFKFWLAGVEQALILKGFSRITPGDGVLARTLTTFAGTLAQSRVESMPRPDADVLLEREVASIPPLTARDRMLFRLLDEAVLRREAGPANASETVAFTFQRFADMFITEALLDGLASAEDLERALRKGGALDYLLSKRSARYAGVLEALATRAPERFGVELADVSPDLSTALGFSASHFIDSLRWRSPGSVTPRTVALFEAYRAALEPDDHDAMDLLVHVSLAPNHPLNADYLHRVLTDMVLAERDAFITRYLLDRFDDGPVQVLLVWAGDETATLDPERARLACILVAWLTSSSNRLIRDQASRALTSLLRRSPGEMAGLIRTFADIDDDYVRERVFASVLGAAAFRTDDSAALRDAALEAWRAVFDKTLVERHAFVRHHARSLVELVAGLGLIDPLIDLARIRPPYRSRAVDDWPEEQDLRPIVDTAPAILSSVVGYFSEKDQRFTMPGDFGKYTLSAASSFYAEPRSDRAPQSRGDIADRFWRHLESRGGEVAERASEALAAADVVSRMQEANWPRLIGALRSGEKVAEGPLEAARARAAEADAALRSVLGPDAVTIPYPDHRSASIPNFPVARARAWVARRAVDLGWSAALHDALEGRLGYGGGGRQEHAVERIGKKYQWIAWHELLGVLQDHYWHEGGDRAPEVLDNLLRVEDLDIDLSFIGAAIDQAPEGLPPMSLPATDWSRPDSIDQGLDWAVRPEDVPHVPDLVEATSFAGDRWWLVRAYGRDAGYMDKLQSDGPFRTGQSAIQLVIVRADEIERLHARQSDGRINTVDMGDQGHFPDRQFGQHRPRLASGGPVLNSEINGIRFGRISRPFGPYRGEYDHGGLEDHPTFEIPRIWLLDELDLRPAGPDAPWFVDGLDRPVLFDPAGIGRREQGTIVNAERLEPWLVTRGYVAAWSLWAEKDGGAGSGQNWSRRDEQPFERATFCGLWWREGGRWRGSTWAATGDSEHAFSHDGDQA